MNLVMLERTWNKYLDEESSQEVRYLLIYSTLRRKLLRWQLLVDRFWLSGDLAGPMCFSHSNQCLARWWKLFSDFLMKIGLLQRNKAKKSLNKSNCHSNWSSTEQHWPVLGCLDYLGACNTWRITPVSKRLVTPTYKPFRWFGRGTTPVRGLTITMVINHLRVLGWSSKWRV